MEPPMKTAEEKNNQEQFELKFEREGQSFYNIFKDGKAWLGSVERTLAIEIASKLNSVNSLKEQLSSLQEEREKLFNLLQKVTVEQVDLSYPLIKSLQEENQRLKEALKDVEVYLGKRVEEYNELPGQVLPEHQRKVMNLNSLYEKVITALNPPLP